jgi:hypothetical protein
MVATERQSASDETAVFSLRRCLQDRRGHRILSRQRPHAQRGRSAAVPFRGRTGRSVGEATGASHCYRSASHFCRGRCRDGSLRPSWRVEALGRRVCRARLRNFLAERREVSAELRHDVILGRASDALFFACGCMISRTSSISLSLFSRLRAFTFRKDGPVVLGLP